MSDPGCPFCEIARGLDTSTELACEAPGWVAFFPPEPATPGHTLVIPRSHVESIWQLGPKDAASVIDGAIKVGKAIRGAVQPDGMNLISSSGSAAEQTIWHAHLHVVPRWHDDPIDPIWPPKQRMDAT